MAGSFVRSFLSLRREWKKKSLSKQELPLPEAGFLVRVHPDPCLILILPQIRALLCTSESKFIPA
jgi:hypothetical protein